MTVDINCDMGESYGKKIIGNDDNIMPYISSANIACGFHGGDPLTIEKTIRLALKFGVGIGAHPGYNDLEGFGRRPMSLTNSEMRASILYQVGALKSMTEVLGGKLLHVKPHGALYNEASKNIEIARVLASTIKEIDSSLVLICMSQSQMINAAREAGLRYSSEVFADRGYEDDGSLVSRDKAGAVLHDTNMVIERVLRMITDKVVESVNGKIIPINADTICIHGDNNDAPAFVKGLAEVLKSNGIKIINNNV